VSLEVISIGSDNLVRLDQLTNASTGAYINNATVNFALKDSNGNLILSGQPMSYVASSNGRYEGTIPNGNTSTMAVNSLWTVEITASSGALILFRRLSCIAKYRAAL
jgi:hypothetical protein